MFLENETCEFFGTLSFIFLPPLCPKLIILHHHLGAIHFYQYWALSIAFILSSCLLFTSSSIFNLTFIESPLEHLDQFLSSRYDSLIFIHFLMPATSILCLLVGRDDNWVCLINSLTLISLYLFRMIKL